MGLTAAAQLRPTAHVVALESGRQFASRYCTTTKLWVRHLSERSSLVLPPLVRAPLLLAFTHARPSTCAALASGCMGGEHQHSVNMEGPSCVVFHEAHDI
jgi:hypothetical protein